MQSQHNPDDIHTAVMRAICVSVADTPMVLKGGTALLLCYGLDRPSEDLDFDSSKKMGLERRIESSLGHEYRIDEIKTLKNTDTVQRLRLVYTHRETEFQRSLKIETSFRDAPIANQASILKGIRVYKLDCIFRQKVQAFYQRTAARDLYDLAFILGKHDFSPDKDSLVRLHQDFKNPTRFREIEQQFREAFQADSLLFRYDFDRIFLQLSERLEESYKRSLFIKPIQGAARGIRM